MVLSIQFEGVNLGLILRQPAGRKSFEELLNHSFGLQKDQYQLIEFIFRQAMMVSGYKYEYEAPMPAKAFVSGQGKAFLAEAKLQIQRWNQVTGGEYGFEGIQVNETHEHSFLVEEYNRLLRELRSKDGLRSKLLSNDIRLSWESTLAEKLKDLLQYNGEQGRGYLAFDKDKFANTVATQFDYFSRYIYVANAVFKKPIEMAASYADNNKLGVAALISEKIRFEHDQIQGIEKFKSSIVKDRLKSGNRAEDELAVFERYFKNFDEFLEMVFSHN